MTWLRRLDSRLASSGARTRNPPTTRSPASSSTTATTRMRRYGSSQPRVAATILVPVLTGLAASCTYLPSHLAFPPAPARSNRRRQDRACSRMTALTDPSERRPWHANAGHGRFRLHRVGGGGPAGRGRGAGDGGRRPVHGGGGLVDRLVGDGHQVTVVDDLSTGRRENLAGALASGRVELAEADLAGPE